MLIALVEEFHELAYAIFDRLHPRDVAHVGAVCRRLRAVGMRDAATHWRQFARTVRALRVPYSMQPRHRFDVIGGCITIIHNYSQLSIRGNVIYYDNGLSPVYECLCVRKVGPDLQSLKYIEYRCLHNPMIQSRYVPTVGYIDVLVWWRMHMVTFMHLLNVRSVRDAILSHVSARDALALELTCRHTRQLIGGLCRG